MMIMMLMVMWVNGLLLGVLIALVSVIRYVRRHPEEMCLLSGVAWWERVSRG